MMKIESWEVAKPTLENFRGWLDSGDVANFNQYFNIKILMPISLQEGATGLSVGAR